MELYCNANGCNTHDYKVSPVWCAYQSEISLRERHVKALEDLAKQKDGQEFEYIKEEPRRYKPPAPPEPKPAPRPSGTGEVGVKWNL
tara:strand:+ start:173 stop:433 length:261 start_codon:yes stop_codon:yes gene_type:complete